jgi:hypothetical protein
MLSVKDGKKKQRREMKMWVRGYNFGQNGYRKAL